MFKNSEIGRNCKYTKFLKNLVLNNDEDTSLPTETRWICLPKVDTVKDTIRSSADVFSEINACWTRKVFNISNRKESACILQ